MAHIKPNHSIHSVNLYRGTDLPIFEQNRKFKKEVEELLLEY